MAAPLKVVLARRYLAFRRSLGYRMRSAELVLDFARFADRAAPRRPLTAALALQWASAVSSARQATRAGRIGMVRGFARYCATLDPRTQIPDTYALGPSFRRVQTHLFTPAETRMILRRTRRLETVRSPLHPFTYETLIGLIACTGMRPGEALRLRLQDFDADRATLRIRPSKFSPERVIPLHRSTVHALAHYRQRRLRLFPEGETFFVGATGRPLQARRTEKVFVRLTADLKPRGQRSSLRLLDFRHTFASQRISQWSREAQPVAHHLLLLARYLGHRTFASTWWYVAADPVALQAASARFRRFHEKRHVA